MKLAIVGSGISGLAAAHLLDPAHEVSLFEAGDRLGGHAHTVDVELEGGVTPVDTGFIVYNETNYPLYTRLLARLGVETEPSDMSFSVTCEKSGLEWGSRSLSALFAKRRNLLRPRFHRMLREILRFNREAPRLLDQEAEKLSLGDYLAGAGYSDDFTQRYAVPMGAAIWSASPADALRFPAATFVRFFANHGLLDHHGGVAWRTIRGGSRRAVRRIVAALRGRIHTSCPVRAIRRTPRGVELVAGDAALRRFDRVILAVHSDQALRLLADASDAERIVLGSIAYQRNDAMLHTDSACMPSLRRAWASWNYRIPARTRERVFVSYHMNRLQNLGVHSDLFVTLNGSDCIDPSRILARFEYDHPVFDARAVEAQKLHDAIDGVRSTHFCGAYWGHGFHEDGVRSAVAVCRKFGREI